MLSPEAHQRFNETVMQTCKDLGIVYDPYRSLPRAEDPRQYVIEDALLSLAEFVQSECEAKHG